MRREESSSDLPPKASNEGSGSADDPTAGEQEDRRRDSPKR